MNPEIQELKQKIEEMDKKIDVILASSESAKRHSRAMLYITIALIVLPAIGIIFAIPSFISTYSASNLGL